MAPQDLVSCVAFRRQLDFPKFLNEYPSVACAELLEFAKVSTLVMATTTTAWNLALASALYLGVLASRWDESFTLMKFPVEQTHV